MSYKNTEIHKFIKSHLEFNNCKVEEYDSHFSVKYPDQMLPTKYTYNPEISETQKIELITPGSRFFNGIIKDSLNQGVISSIRIEPSSENQIEQIKSFFSFKDSRCDQCSKGNYEQCPKLIKCGHKINGATIKNIRQSKNSDKTILQFYFLVEFSNRLRKSEEIIPVAISEEDIINPIDIYDSKTVVKENLINQKLETDKSIKRAIGFLKHSIKKKAEFFNKQIDYEIAKKIQSIEKKFKDERIEKLLNKEKFDQKEWEKNLQKTIDSEKKSLGTIVSIKLINCLLITVPSSKYSIELSNGSVIDVEVIERFYKYFHPKCNHCKKKITEGYATEDKKYVCDNCKIRCIETGKIFSMDAKDKLQLCSTSGEVLSDGCGFKCSNCNMTHSKNFMYRCSSSGEPVCVKCYDFCSHCDKQFSIKNMKQCKESSGFYCKVHSIPCGKCGSSIGLDKARFSGESQDVFCSCINLSQCKLCEDYYTNQYLVDGKCQACKNLKMVISDNQEIAQIRAKNKDYERTTDWMVGHNKFNKIIVAKGDPVDSIFVANPKMIRFIKKARISDL